METVRIESMDPDLPDQRPAVIAFIESMMTAVQVQKVGAQLGFEVFIISSAHEFVGFIPSSSSPPGEPLFGREGKLLDYVTTIQPSLLIFDLSNHHIPWREWIAVLKSSPATRNLPILCFGPHVDKDAFKAVVDLKVESVVARSKFMAQMPKLIKDIALNSTDADVELSCQTPVSALGLKGLQMFNKGEYFEAHEFLEDAWNEDSSPSRNVYKGVLQVAVAYLQIERSNYRGAIKMFLRSRQWLSPLPDTCRGINIAQLRQDAERVHRQILDLGPAGIEKFNRSQFSPVEFVLPT